MAVENWDTNDTLNLTLEGIDVAEGSQPRWFNDMFRKMAAAMRVFYNKSYRKGETIKYQATGGALPGTAEDGDILIEYTP